MVGSWQIEHVDASLRSLLLYRVIGFGFLHIHCLVHVSVKHRVDAASRGETASLVRSWFMLPHLVVSRNGG
jgi:hypothetical protein